MFITAGEVRFARGSVVDCRHLEKNRFGILETPLKIWNRQFCLGIERLVVGNRLRIETCKPSVPTFLDKCDNSLETIY